MCDISDGASVCGLYLAATNLIDQIDREKEVDVFYTVQQIKASRPEFIDCEVWLVESSQFKMIDMEMWSLYGQGKDMWGVFFVKLLITMLFFII